MFGNVLHEFAVDENTTAVIQGGKVFLSSAEL
jgi:hypothetical protein